MATSAKLLQAIVKWGPYKKVCLDRFSKQFSFCIYFVIMLFLLEYKVGASNVVVTYPILTDVVEKILPLVDSPQLADQFHWTGLKLCGWLKNHRAIDLAYSTLFALFARAKLRSPHPSSSARASRQRSMASQTRNISPTTHPTHPGPQCHTIFWQRSRI